MKKSWLTMIKYYPLELKSIPWKTKNSMVSDSKGKNINDLNGVRSMK